MTAGHWCRYLGLFTTELEAAQAYDRESVTRKGVDAITNFDLSHYTELLSSEDLEEVKRRGLLSAPEPATADESAELAAWQEAPDQELDSMTTLLQGMSKSFTLLTDTGVAGRITCHVSHAPLAAALEAFSWSVTATRDSTTPLQKLHSGRLGPRKQ